MIGFLKGKILSVEHSGGMAVAIVETSGVGYEVHVSARGADTLMPGRDCAVHIYTHLRADGRGDSSLELYGFSSAWEKKVFLMLTSVSGVGFRTALNILNAVDPKPLLQAIVRQDRASLTAAPGVGKKTVERILLELTEKATKLLAERPRDTNDTTTAAVAAAVTTAVPGFTDGDEPDFWSEAQQALVALGFREADAASALRDTYRDSAGKDLSVQGFVRGALSRLRNV